MADATVSTTVSRRSMLAGGAAAAALPAVAALPAAGAPARDRPNHAPGPDGDPDPDPDAELFRRIAEAEHWRNRHARACRLRDRLWAALLRRDPGWTPFAPAAPTAGHIKWLDIAEAAGEGGAGLRWLPLFRRYAEAVRRAVAVPAHTARGAHAKLALALIAARRGDARVYLYEDHAYVTAALADLDRLAAREAAGRGRGA